MEDAMVLLQTGKRFATAAFHRESICLSDDSFSFNRSPLSDEASINNLQPSTPPKTESESISQLLSHIKLLICCKTAAMAALEPGFILKPLDIFRKLSMAVLEPALDARLYSCTTLFYAIKKMPGPVWKRQNIQYWEIPGKLSSLAVKIQQLKQRVAAGETGNVDYYALIGLRRACSRSELERAHLLLTLRHKPDKSSSFIDRCEFADDGDIDSIRDRAKMSALLLYRLIQKGYTSVMGTILDDEASEKQGPFCGRHFACSVRI